MTAAEPDPNAADLRTDVPHPARIYDHLLGGKDNFPADRAAAGITAGWPNLATSMRANRDFLRRMVSHWHPDAGTPAVPDAHVHMYGGVGLKL